MRPSQPQLALWTRQPKASIAILLAAIMLSSCFSGPPVLECTWAKPILVSRADVLTPGTAGQVLAHNRKWQEFCEE